MNRPPALAQFKRRIVPGMVLAVRDHWIEKYRGTRRIVHSVQGNGYWFFTAGQEQAGRGWSGWEPATRYSYPAPDRYRFQQDGKYWEIELTSETAPVPKRTRDLIHRRTNEERRGCLTSYQYSVNHEGNNYVFRSLDAAHKFIEKRGIEPAPATPKCEQCGSEKMTTRANDVLDCDACGHEQRPTAQAGCPGGA